MTARPAADLLRDAIADLAADPDWIGGISATVTAAIHAELGIDPDLRGRTQAAAESVIGLFIEMVAAEQPLDEAQPPYPAVDYTREFVVRGVPLDIMLRAYHTGHAAFVESWLAALREHVADPADLADVIEAGAAWPFQFLQALTRDLVRRYAEERERWLRSAASLRSETVRALLSGEDLDLSLASQRLRYELDREHLAFVVWADEHDADHASFGALEAQAMELAKGLGAANPLLVPLGGQLIAGWIAGGQELEVPARLEPPALAALGRRGAGVEGFCRSHRQALSSRRVAALGGSRPGAITRFDDVALTALASVDEHAARDFVASELGALADRDDDTLRLAATLRAYLEERSSPRRTAKRLGVHENTIKNRIRTIEDLRGQPADQRVAETLVALRLARIVTAPSADA